MKIVLILVILGVAGYFGWKAIQTKPDAGVPSATVSETPINNNTDTQAQPSNTPANVQEVDNSGVSVAFTGFGPGKQHKGNFSDVRSNLSFDAQGSLGGTITIGVDSLTTDTEGVTKHLKTDAFFDVAKYPTATFKLTNLSDTEASGAFTIHGVTKTLSFPVTKTGTGYGTRFTFSLKDFGIDQTFANETVELSVFVPVK